MSVLPKNFVPVSQTDPRWKTKKYANGVYTIGEKGCALTALTNVINSVSTSALTPPQVDEKLKAVGGYSGANLYWVKVPKAFPQLKFIYRDWNYSNPIVSYYVYLLHMPVIVAVRTPFTPLHFVTYIGDTKMIDSQDGKIKSTGFYPTRTGSVRYQRA